MRSAPSRHLALAFLLGAALVGGALGFSADRLMARDQYPRWGDQEAMRHRFYDEISADAYQRATIDTILNTKHHEIAELVKPVRPQIDSVCDAAYGRIKALLTPQQQAIYEDMHRIAKANEAKYDK
jgi:hypothetical protein